MEPIRIKICGIRTLDEALRAVEAGADLLGFNFYPSSPRYISYAACARIREAMDLRGISVGLVGVFVNHAVEEVGRVVAECGLDLAQLSGDEPPEDLAALSHMAFKAIRPTDLAAALQDARRYASPSVSPALLVDAHRPGQYGGTGQTGDWGAARSLAGQYPILLAGGLRPENVARALEQVHPWGVDAASGVEAEPGRKDFEKMAAFVHAVRSYSMEENRC